jgi:heterodisulfide reductase subunit D
MFEKTVQETKAYYCLECGICTASCPVSRYYPEFSPRILVERALLGTDDEMLAEREVWTCLTCGTCTARCPSKVDYNEFTRRTRVAAREGGYRGVDTHAGTVLALHELDAERRSKRELGWIAPDLKVAKKGSVLLFTGCLPYFDVVFRDLGVDTVGMVNSVIRLMNACGRRPALSADERCCGHDLYWTGDTRTFRKLARSNLRMIEDVGAATVVFACPECYATFKLIYPRYFGPLRFEVAHITEFLAPYAARGKVSFDERPSTVTYQDPCRLGRYLGVYEAPRDLLAAVPGLGLTEMPRARAEAVCCGSSGWVSCTRINKSVQKERLREAADTGATKLLTACPKCNIHLSCAAKDSDLETDIGIEYVATFLAEALQD